MADDSSADVEPRPRPIEEVLPSPQLLAHYKGRIDAFERERDALLAAVDRCGVHRDDVHRLEWENRKRADEVKELQKALSDAQQFLFEERQRLLLLQAENDELKLQELQDRQRIQQLLGMTSAQQHHDPAVLTEQTVTYRQGGPPSSVTAYKQQQQAAGGAGRAAAAASSSSAAAAAGGAGSGSGSKGERVLRTVFLPTVDTDFLLLKVESLQAQLNEQKQLHEERVAALLADRQLRAQEEERQRANLMVQVEALGRQVKDLEAALQTTTRDYITARRERLDAQAAAAAAQAQMTQEVSAARSKLAAVRRQAKADVERAAAAADGRMREYVDKFREQVRSREEELLNLTSLHTATKSAADSRIESLEGRVARLLEANKQLELRRQLDVDGWTADVTSLRKTLAAVDRKLLQMRLIDRLEDDERLDALLDQLEKRAPTLAQEQQQQQAKLQQQAQQQQQLGRRGSRQAVGPSGGGGGARRGGAVGGSGGRRPPMGSRPAGVGAAAGGSSRRVGAGGLRQSAAARQSDQQRQQQQQQRRPLDEGSEDEEEQEGMDAGLDVELSAAAGASASGLSPEDSGLSSALTDTGSSLSGAPSSIKSTLAAELAAVRRQLAELELLAGQKAARALAGVNPQTRQQL